MREPGAMRSGGSNESEAKRLGPRSTIVAPLAGATIVLDRLSYPQLEQKRAAPSSGLRQAEQRRSLSSSSCSRSIAAKHSDRPKADAMGSGGDAVDSGFVPGTTPARRDLCPERLPFGGARVPATHLTGRVV